MTELLTAAQMRAIEAAAIASGAVTGLELMERAGRGVVDAVWEEWPELRAGSFRAVVLCGPGNNGGDGFVVARLLKEWGWEVEVFLYGDPEKMPPDARVNYERWVEMGEVRPSVEYDPWSTVAEVHIDALFGIGMSRTPEGEVARLIDSMISGARKTRHGKLVAVDVPSGLCADSGRDLNIPNKRWQCADMTASFQYFKQGHFLGDGPLACGRLRLVDIGLSAKQSMNTLKGKYDKATGTRPNRAVVSRLVNEVWYRPEFIGGYSVLDKYNAGAGEEVHKFTHGHALILSGPSGQGGAARLSARGALRIGAGLVTLGCPPEAIAENAAQLNAIMLRPIGVSAALAEVLEDKRITALCLGPGMGVDASATGLVAVALAQRRGGGPRPTRGGGGAAGGGEGWRWARGKKEYKNPRQKKSIGASINL